ncbi:MAG: NAD(+) diphosphatase [Phyllobacterium sp.]
MTFRLFDAPLIEPSQSVGFAGGRIDRQSEKRNNDSAKLALADPQARLLFLRQGRVHLKFSESGAQALFPQAFFPLSDADILQPDLERAILLGIQDGTPILAAPARLEEDDLPGDWKAVDYRFVYMEGLLPPDQLGALAQAAALMAWHDNHRFCGRCGSETDMQDGGYKRLCPSCGAQHFPRTDPVAIMLAVRGDKCLLARSPHFRPGMYSCLAGFIEPGETIENAVRRETLEEMGMPVGRVAYHASQPWPFPYSLMIGCHAEALSDAFTVDRSELEDGRWFSRDEVLSMLNGTHADGLAIPPAGAIAAHLIRSWAES